MKVAQEERGSNQGQLSGRVLRNLLRQSEFAADFQWRFHDRR